MAVPTQEERDSVRSYMVTRAARLSLADLVAKMRTDAESLRQAFAAVPRATWRERPAAGEWSAAELAGHALEVLERDSAAVDAILDGQQPPAFILDVVGAEVPGVPDDAEAFWDAFSTRRDTIYARVLAVRGDEHLDVTIDHPWFGPLNWREWLLFVRVHDLDHVRYLRELAGLAEGGS